MSATPFLVIGIDGGGSHTAGRILDDSGNCLGSALAGPSNFRKIGLNTALSVIIQVVDKAWKQVEAKQPDFTIAALGMGLAGVDRPEDKELILKELIALPDCRLGILARSLPRDRLLIVNDAEAALTGGVGKREGVVAVAGTGSIVWGRNARGEVSRAGGWGHLLGDPGSAFAIGCRGIREAFRAFDGLNPQTSLQNRLLNHYRLSRYAEFLDLAYADSFSPADWASFAPLVDEAAAEGDEISCQIIIEAADDLVEMTVPVIKNLFAPNYICDVVTAGGVWSSRSGFRKRFTTKISQILPIVSVVEPLHDAAWGACLLAQYFIKSW
ncbi:MAG: BadF/BadG/BcrA/BcrD ATPase family protein [Calditrichota bacterium]